MPKQTIAYLKSKFLAFMKPRAEDYADIFDSFVHKDDLEGINNSAVDMRINTYDTALRSITPGAMDTLGDVFKVFEGWPDNWNLKQKIEAASGQAVTWNSIQDRPASVEVTWSEQIVTYNFNPVGTGLPNNFIATGQSLKQLLNLPNGTRTVITDISLSPYVLAVSGVNLVLNKVASVTFAISPKISLT